MNPDLTIKSWENKMTIEFTSPELTELTPKITVFGVGGASGNAVNNMVNAARKGVDFVYANTDAQALSLSLAEQKIKLGAELTQGSGAGARPEVGRADAEETMDAIEEHLEGCHMAFITAGMGGLDSRYFHCSSRFRRKEKNESCRRGYQGIEKVL